MDVHTVFPRAFYYETSKQGFLFEIIGSVTRNILFQFLYGSDGRVEIGHGVSLPETG
jgi:hypothetical protein